MSTGGQSILMIFIGAMVILVAAPLFDAQRRRESIIVAAMYTLYVTLAASAHMWIIAHTPVTLDPKLLAADRFLHLDAFRAATVMRQFRPLMLLLTVAYSSLSIVFGICWSVERSRVLLLAYLAGGIACFFVYAAFPAVGPGWYDWQSKVAPAVPRNCIPSMHLTWALLLAWNARHPLLKYPLIAYAALVAGATIALGQHYFIDLLMAVPFTAMVQIGSTRLLRARTAVPQLQQLRLGDARA